MQLVIELDGLTTRFGSLEALKQLHGSFSGRAIGLLGPNGAGKTTLIHTLLGFHRPASGTARIFGNDLSNPLKLGICELSTTISHLSLIKDLLVYVSASSAFAVLQTSSREGMGKALPAALLQPAHRHSDTQAARFGD